MFANLHTLPAGQHMYTLYLTTQPAGTPSDELFIDEIDFVASASMTMGAVARKARKDGALEDYAPGSRVIAIEDQSSGDACEDLDGDLAEELG